MNGTWIVETVIAVAVLFIGVRSFSYAIYEWKRNKAGAVLMMLIAVLMAGLCSRSLFW